MVLDSFPWADMLNHRIRSDPRTCDWKVESNHFVIRTSKKGLKAGSEAFHSYVHIALV